jgi:hypothetical protein
MSIRVSPAPVSSPVTSDTYQRWFDDLGRFAEAATKSGSLKDAAGNAINYVRNGALVHINYTGLGGFTAALPFKAKFDALIQTSENTTLVLTAGEKTLNIPTYTKQVVVHGAYFCG